MSGPYNPPPGGNPPGEQPHWGGYPGGAYPQPGQTGYPGQAGYQQGGGYNYPQQTGYQPGGQQQGGYGYQQPAGYGYEQRDWRGYSSQPREKVGIIGLALAVVGAVLLILSFTTLNWYKPPGGKFSDLHDAAKAADAGLAKAFSGWLAWVLVALVIITAVLANLPIGGMALTFRIIAPVLGILGIVLTLLALNNYWSKVKDAAQAQGIDVGIFNHSEIGLYFALAGFLIAGIAGVFGPRRT